ncbi:MAG: metallophosphoesterase [Lachnospiraceae bacterium]|nr:metallophosphoesterase [Lachnospiraceae bacterium]
MIYITGDTHNTEDMSNLSSKNMKLCCMEQNADFHAITTAIILGDFGLPWSSDCTVDESGIHPTDHTDRYLLKWYNQKPFKILAVMGNHDNYDIIEKLPEVEMFGSTVLKVSDNVFYLKRGEIYTIDDKRFLILGGAMSDDKAWRKPHESWWEQEAWNAEEQTRCMARIQECGRQFDYVLSHTGATRGIACVFDSTDGSIDATVAFNDKVDAMITYKKWFFGHWHSDWGYEHFAESQYVPLYHKGIAL